MSLESAWARLMRYCDGEEVYSAIAHADQVREHLRTDIMAVNDARLEQLAAAEREKNTFGAELGQLRAAVGELWGRRDEWDAGSVDFLASIYAEYVEGSNNELRLEAKLAAAERKIKAALKVCDTVLDDDRLPTDATVSERTLALAVRAAIDAARDGAGEGES